MKSQKPNNSLAIASPVLALLSVVCLGLLAGIPAMIFGQEAPNRAGPSPEPGSWDPPTKAKERAWAIICVNNLKQVGLAFRQWALDHDDRFPFNVPSPQGGTRELCAPDRQGFDTNAVAHFQVMSNELFSPNILVCPADASKKPALDFPHLRATNVSYQVRSGANLSEESPTELLVRCPVHGYTVTCAGTVKTNK
jgi:hypothetical protein